MLFFPLFFPKIAFSSNSPNFAKVSVSEWFSFADASWQTSGPFLSGSFISKLEFDDIDSNITTVTGEIKPFSWLAVDLTYGSGSIGKGTVTDSDWITVPSLGLTNFLRSESKSEINDDKTILLLFNFYFDTLNLMNFNHSSNFRLDFFLGGMFYYDNLKFVNGVQTIINEVEVSIPLEGLNSTYDFSWNAVRVGVRTGYQLPKDLFLKGKFAYLPYINYDGEAFWNLRTDFRSTKPNFIHDATGYLGFDLNFTFGYQPVDWFVLSAGYNFLYMNAKNGIDTTFFADGSKSTGKLDEVKVRRHGPFVNISLIY